jgi:hypothetical protein
VVCASFASLAATVAVVAYCVGKGTVVGDMSKTHLLSRTLSSMHDRLIFKEVYEMLRS